MVTGGCPSLAIEAHGVSIFSSHHHGNMEDMEDMKDGF